MHDRDDRLRQGIGLLLEARRQTTLPAAERDAAITEAAALADAIAAVRGQLRAEDAPDRLMQVLRGG